MAKAGASISRWIADGKARASSALDTLTSGRSSRIGRTEQGKGQEDLPENPFDAVQSSWVQASMSKVSETIFEACDSRFNAVEARATTLEQESQPRLTTVCLMHRNFTSPRRSYL